MFSRPRIKLKSVHISCNCHRQNSTNPHSTLFTFAIFKWKNKKQKEENNAPRLCMKSVRTHASMLLYTEESEEGWLYKRKSTWICSLHFNPSPSVCTEHQPIRSQSSVLPVEAAPCFHWQHQELDFLYETGIKWTSPERKTHFTCSYKQ